MRTPCFPSQLLMYVPEKLWKRLQLVCITHHACALFPVLTAHVGLADVSLRGHAETVIAVTRWSRGNGDCGHAVVKRKRSRGNGESSITVIAELHVQWFRDLLLKSLLSPMPLNRCFFFFFVCVLLLDHACCVCGAAHSLIARAAQKYGF